MERRVMLLNRHLDGSAVTPALPHHMRNAPHVWPAGGETRIPAQAELGRGTLESNGSSMARLLQALCLGQTLLRFRTIRLQ